MSQSETPAVHDISREIWNRKYRFQGNDVAEADTSYEETWSRVAKAVAKNEDDSKKWEKEFYSILEDFRFIPAGRIIANAGTAREEVTMFNCYVMNKINDSIEGIFETVKDAALTQKQGGGVGFDFSTIRPANSHIRGCGANSSGPLSFMQVLDATCRTIMSAGQRRGAQMGVMRCDHPDVEEFITAKRKNDSLKMFNLSVAITDKFIQAVKNDDEWELTFEGKVYKTIRASHLWDLIMKSTYDFAEPGFILIDKINEMNNLHYCEEIRATNPCGEQPLPPYGACLLGSLNLTRFVQNPFTSKAKIKYKELEKVTKVATRMLDNVIDVSNYPMEQQREEAYAKRRMGIGLTGLADLFIFLGVKYGSPESLAITEKVMQTITHTAYRTSIELGQEKGVFAKFDAEQYCSGKFILSLPKDIQADIRKLGLRNSHLTSIAPTGTISLFAGNISSGLEPVFAFHYNRKIRNTSENDVTEVEVADYAYNKYRDFMGVDTIEDAELPDYFVPSAHVTADEHLDIQATLQKYVDSSISKTINVPSDYDFEKFKDIYMKAYEKGLKGCTTFRPSEFITGVLSTKDEKKEEEKAKEAVLDKAQRPKELEGTTYQIKTPLAADALYVTINDLINEDGSRRPYELFINTKNLQHFSWVVAMTRLISAVFRHQTNPAYLVSELKSIYDPNGGYYSEGKYIPSLVADIGRIIELHLSKIGLLEDKPAPAAKEVPKASKDANKETADNSGLMICPTCNEKALLNQENCLKCLSCGYSKCG